jgi:hypothetical protein
LNKSLELSSSGLCFISKLASEDSSPTATARVQPPVEGVRDSCSLTLSDSVNTRERTLNVRLYTVGDGTNNYMRFTYNCHCAITSCLSLN